MKIPQKKIKVGNLTFDMSGGRMVMLLTAVFIFIVVVVLYFTVLRGTPGVSGAQIAPPPKIEGAAVGGVGTPQYNAAVEQQNKQEVAKAEQTGGSVIATPVNLSDKKVNLDLLNLGAPAKPPAVPALPQASAPVVEPVVAVPPPKPPAPPLPIQQADYVNKDIQSEMKNVIDNVSKLESGGTTQILTPSVPASILLAQAAREDSASTASASGAGSSSSVVDSNPLLKRLLRPGSIIYAEFTTRLKSTLPSPVIGEIAQGPLSGYKLIGAWTRAKDVDAMTIQFSQIVLPDGTTAPLTAFAVDPNSTLPAVASSVDYHVLSRTANFMGATFLAVLNGYSQAYAQAGQQIVATPSSTTVVTPPFSAEQARAAAMVQATNMLQPLSSMMMTKVMQPDTINVAPGTPFGLLVLKQ